MRSGSPGPAPTSDTRPIRRGDSGTAAIFSRAKRGHNIGGILLPVPQQTSAGGQLSQAERAYQEIKWRIVYGQYKPGAHLSEATLARVHRTSRTPIREALARLSEEQYVVWDAGRGFLIAPVTVSRIRDTFQVRRLLEGAAAGGAAEMATPVEISGMAALAEYHYAVGDAESYRAALARNLDFHL